MSSVIFAFIALITVILPDAGEVPGISGEAEVAGAIVDGSSWLRILETDYAVLQVTVEPASSMTAYDNQGDPLVVSPEGAPLVLSAYSDYWFWVKADNGNAVFTVEYVQPSDFAGNTVSSGLSSAEMAEIWAFVPDEDGRWNFFLRGADENTDLDLEIYSAGNTLLGGSYSLNSTEKLSMNLLAGENVQLMISRYNKGGTGEYTLEMVRAGDFPILETGMTGDAIQGNVQRYMLPELEEDTFLELSFQEDGDLDIYVTDLDGNDICSSSTYFYSEGVLLEAGVTGIVEIYPYDIGEDLASFPWTVFLSGLSGELTGDSKTLVQTGYGQSPLLGFTAPSSGFYTVSAVFDKLRDGDLRLFDDFGEPAVFLSTERGDESFCFWIDGGSKVWVVPCFINPSSGGACEVSVSPSETEVLTGLVHGRIDDTTGSRDYYTVRGEAGTTLVVELRGDQRDFDLDMLVSGPGYVLQAEGGLSNTDSAADEAVTLYCREDGYYGITVYSYERSGEGTYTLEAERIPAERLAAGNPSPETWAVVAGISGYQSRADILSRASMDAIEMYRFLRDEQGTDPDHMILLVDAEATSSMFRNAIGDISRRAGVEDRLVVFYSGHGSQEAPGSGGAEEADGMNEVLCFYDEDLNDDTIRELLSEFPGYCYLFADACHSGGLVNDFSQDDGVLLLTAAREDKSVSERILTPILLEASRGAADSNGDGIISAGELVSHVDEMLARICPVCDAVVDQGMAECPECGTVLKGEYRIPRPEQGLYLPADHQVWN